MQKSRYLFTILMIIFAISWLHAQNSSSYSSQSKKKEMNMWGSRVDCVVIDLYAIQGHSVAEARTTAKKYDLHSSSKKAIKKITNNAQKVEITWQHDLEHDLSFFPQHVQEVIAAQSNQLRNLYFSDDSLKTITTVDHAVHHVTKFYQAYAALIPHLLVAMKTTNS